MKTLLLQKKSQAFSGALKFFIAAILFVSVILPLIFVFAKLGEVNIGSMFASEKFRQSALNSLWVGLTATILAMSFAFLLAFCIARSNIRYKGIFTIVLTVPMLIPSISHGMGLIVLFGSNGIIPQLFGMQTAGIYGFWGIVLGSLMYSFPTAFLMFSDILKYEDRAVYEAADIMGIPKFRQFCNITLPYLAKPLISIFFATFTLIFTDYGVPMMVGGRYVTLPLYMYHEVIGQLNFGVGAVVAIVLLIPAVIACIFDIIKKDSGNSNTVQKNVLTRPSRKRDIASYIFCSVSVFCAIAPIIVFSVIGFIKKFPIDMTFGFSNFLTAINFKAGKFLGNSLLISVLVGVVGTLVSYFTAYVTARVKGKSNKFLHLISLSSLAVPGVVLGIAYSLMYKGSFLMGTLAILVFVNIVHFFSSPYIMCYNAMNKVNKNYELISQTMGVGKFRFIKDILFPETFDTVIEMFAYFFVNSMVTISAVSFLATSANTPLSLLINQFEQMMLIECSAIVSLFILLINGIVKLTIYLIKRRRMIKNAY